MESFYCATFAITGKRRSDQLEEDFFVWLDYGEEDHRPAMCPRAKLMKSTVAFLDEQQRKAAGRAEWKRFARVEGPASLCIQGLRNSKGDAKLLRKSHSDVWIFVLTIDGEMYVGKK